MCLLFCEKYRTKNPTLRNSIEILAHFPTRVAVYCVALKVHLKVCLTVPAPHSVISCRASLLGCSLSANKKHEHNPSPGNKQALQRKLCRGPQASTRSQEEMSGSGNGVWASLSMKNKTEPTNRMHITLCKPKKIVKETTYPYKPIKSQSSQLCQKTCDFPAKAGSLYFAYWTCTTKLRFSS